MQRPIATLFRLSAVLLTAGAIFIACPASAKDKGHGHGRGHGTEVSHHDDRIVIIDTDRSRIRDFLAERRNCPPGLAKKHNGCLPPGQAKKHYVGEVLVVERTQSIWHDLADLLSPPPSGYRYVRADNDVVLIDRGNRIVDLVSVD